MTSIAPTNDTSAFLQKLRDSRCPIGDLVIGLGIGRVALPDILESRSRRWVWFADLLSNSQWGIATDLPDLAAYCDQIADLCRQTAEPVHRDTLPRQWAALVPRIAAARRTHCNIGEPETLDMLADLVVDGRDDCKGGDPTGFEALLGYIIAISKLRGTAARRTLVWAAEWGATAPESVGETAV